MTNVFLVLLIHSSPEQEKRSSSTDDESSSPSSAPERMPNVNNRKRISLEESINQFTKKQFNNTERIKASQERWDRALKEIKNLAVPMRSTSLDDNKSMRDATTSLFRRWRLLLDEPTKVELDPKTNTTIATVVRNVNSSSTRFDGFASWERTLQDWADDVQDYIDKIEIENKGKGYPMSQYGNAERKILPSSLSIDAQVEENLKVDENSQSIHTNKRKIRLDYRFLLRERTTKMWFLTLIFLTSRREY